MAKAPAKTNWKLIGGMLLLLVIGYVWSTSGGDEKVATKKTVAKAKSSLDKTTELYKKEDYTAKFASLKEEPKYAFKPLVVKSTGPVNAGGAAADSDPGMSITGEPGWLFTGSPELDGVRSALLDNTTTGESVFLNVGDHWKNGHVKSIGADAMVFVGNDGTEKTVKLLDPSVVISKGGKATNGAVAQGTVAPLQPPALSGTIGGGANGMSLAATGNMTPEELAAMQQQQGMQRGGGRRGGRGRNRGQGQGNDNGN